MCIEHEWELIDEKFGNGDSWRTRRMKVPGGWLYCHEYELPFSETSCQVVMSMAFVPEPCNKARGVRIRRRPKDPSRKKLSGTSRD